MCTDNYIIHFILDFQLWWIGPTAKNVSNKIYIMGKCYNIYLNENIPTCQQQENVLAFADSNAQ